MAHPFDLRCVLTWNADLGIAGRRALAHHAAAQARQMAGRPVWSVAMRLAWKADVVQCHCGGRPTLVALLDQPLVVGRILAHLGLAAEVLTKTEESTWRVRWPPDELLQGDLDDAGLPVAVDGFDEEPGEPSCVELPAEDGAAWLGDLTIGWLAEPCLDPANEPERT